MHFLKKRIAWKLCHRFLSVHCTPLAQCLMYLLLSLIHWELSCTRAMFLPFSAKCVPVRATHVLLRAKYLPGSAKHLPMHAMFLPFYAMCVPVRAIHVLLCAKYLLGSAKHLPMYAKYLPKRARYFPVSDKHLPIPAQSPLSDEAHLPAIEPQGLSPDDPEECLHLLLRAGGRVHGKQRTALPTAGKGGSRILQLRQTLKV